MLMLMYASISYYRERLFFPVPCCTDACLIVLFHTFNITQGGGLTGVCGKTVAGSYIIQDGRRIIAAAVLATLLAKSGNNYVLATRAAEKAHTKALYN